MIHAHNIHVEAAAKPQLDSRCLTIQNG